MDSMRMFKDIFKLTIRYGGYFKTVGARKHWKYCFGRQKTIGIEPGSYNMDTLHEDIQALFKWGVNDGIKIWYKNRGKTAKVFWPVDTDKQLEEAFKAYKDMRKCELYVTIVTANPLNVLPSPNPKSSYPKRQTTQSTPNTRVELHDGGSSSGEEFILIDSEDELEGVNVDDAEAVGADIDDDSSEDDDQEIGDDTHSGQSHNDSSGYDSGDAHSEESYHSLYSSGPEDTISDFEGETYVCDRDNPNMEVGAKNEDVHQFRRALQHYAVLNEFNVVIIKSDPSRVTARCEKHECQWRIHASVAQDKKTFVVKKLKSEHTCPSVNKCGNKMASQYWLADRVVEWIRREGDVSVAEIRRRIKEKYHLDLPYHRLWRGKEIAIDMIHGKWEDSYERLNDFMEELGSRNPGSVIKFLTEDIGEKKHFMRVFICLGACSMGFLAGCRPFVGLDGCHMKGKYQGVVLSVTGIDGNNGMFPLAFGVVESENKDSWAWFLSGLREAIGEPEGLVMASDRQKGLEEALPIVFPDAEHRNCMRHIYKNFKKKFSGNMFERILWTASRSFTITGYMPAMEELQQASPEAYSYIVRERLGFWSRHQFGTIAKCHYITNNLSESFNAWISDPRHRPVIDLLDLVRQKIMTMMEQRRVACRRWKSTLVSVVVKHLRKLSTGLGEYEVRRSADSKAEVCGCGTRCEVLLSEKICTCRRWQVTGIPCVHACAFIASIRGANWEDYVDPFFTIEKYRAAYCMEIAPMPDRSEWVKLDLGYKILPPPFRRPIGRPRKNRIKDPNESNKKRHKCKRCGMFGHHAKTCKNPIPTPASQEGTSTVAGPDGTQTSTAASNVGGRPRKKSKNVPSTSVAYPVFVPPKIKSRGRPRKRNRKEPSHGADEAFAETWEQQTQAEVFESGTSMAGQAKEGPMPYWGMDGDVS